MSSIVPDPTPGSSTSETEYRPKVQGQIDYAANNGTAIAYSENTIINVTHNHYNSSKLVPAPVELEGDAPITEKPAPQQEDFAFDSKKPDINDEETVDCGSSTRPSEKDATFVSLSPEMKSYLEFLTVIEKASPPFRVESDGQHLPYLFPIGLPVNPPQSAPGNLTFEEELCMLSPRMQNYLNILGGNQEGTLLVDELKMFYRVASESSSGYGNSDVASPLGPFAKDLHYMSPRMQQYITALIPMNPDEARSSSKAGKVTTSRCSACFSTAPGLSMSSCKPEF